MAYNAIKQAGILGARATDGAGGVQAAEQVGTVLDCATGYYRVAVTLA